MAKPKKVVW